MRIILIRILATLTFSVVPQVVTSHAATELAQWDFNQPDPLKSSVNSSYDLTVGGGVSFVPSPWGTAALFHGGTFPLTDPATFSNPSLDRLDTAISPASPSFNGGFSIMGMVNPFVVSSGNGHVLVHDSSAVDFPNNLGFQFSVYSTLEVMLRNTADQRLLVVASGNPISANQWYHVAVTWDGSSSGGVTMYVNGQSVPTVTLHADAGFQGLNSSDPLPVRLGAQEGNSDNDVSSFNGELDHISFWDGPLTAEDVQRDFRATQAVPDQLSTLESLAWSIAAIAMVRRLRSRV